MSPVPSHPRSPPIAPSLSCSSSAFPPPVQSERAGKNGHGCDIFLGQGANMLSQSAEVTGLLKAWSDGDQAALDRLTGHVYSELRLIARRYMRNQRAGNTLQTTALVNEAYLRLVDVKNVTWEHRTQFFAVAAQM